MRHLPAITWASLALGAGACLLTSTNPLVAITIITGCLLAAAFRQGPRLRTFTRTMTLGLATALLVLVIGLATGASSSQTSVLFELPTVVLGNDVSFGGLYTTHRLMVTAAAALEVVAWACLLGLLGQACPAGEWCDLATTILGRGAQLLAPTLCLGEALSRQRGRLNLTELLRLDAQVVQAWRRHRPPPRPSARASLVAGAVLVLLGGGALAVAALGGLRTELLPGRTLSGLALLGAACVVWVVLRVVTGASLASAPSVISLIAAAAGLLPLVLRLATVPAGEQGALQTAAGSWPTVPPVTLATLVVAFAFTCLGTLVQARRPHEVVAHA